MDKNAIKKYAVWARTELIERVRQRALKYEVAADADINADSASGKVLTDIEKTQRQAAIARMREKGYEYVIEEVAYTWFNRFAALRYMEVNNYLPTRVRVFTDESGTFKPQILTEAIHLNLDGLDMEKVYALKEAENNDELYKYLLLTQCNALSSVLPQMFKPVDDRCKEEKNDYTLLLFPDNQLREGSVIEQMVSLIPEDNWLDAVQIIGWLYQYYNSEPKDKVFADLKKNIKITKENIPAATQLFTPDWIVRYMVENSLGRLWLEGHPNDALKSEWKYYLDEALQESEVEAQLAEIRKEYAALKPEDILCIDPCMGSGHILAYLFETLMKIYAAYGYSIRESVQSIIEHNLYGLDIDDRAAQLAYFEVMMTAVKYDNRFLKRSEVPQPHVYAIQESNHIQYEKEFSDFLLLEEHRETLRYLLGVFQDAKEYGSILQVEKRDYAGFMKAWKSCAEASLENIMMMGWYMQANERVQALARQAIALSQKYDVVVTNPPYMGSSNMNRRLSNFVKKNYADYKSDFFSAFIVKCSDMAKTNGKLGFFTPYVWMFIQSYEKMRNYLYDRTIETLIQFEYSAFEEATVPVCTFSFSNYHTNKKGCYLRLTEFRGGMEVQRKKTLEAIRNHNCGFYYEQSMNNVSKIPGAPVAYWVSENFIRAFDKGTLNDIGKARSGLQTGNNDLYLKFWQEVCWDKIAFKMHTKKEFFTSQKKWLPQIKGGEYRKWYGNFDYIVNWENDGEQIKKCSGCRLNAMANDNLFFIEGITWSHTTSGVFGARFLPFGHLFNVEAPTYFIETDKQQYVLAMLNSSVIQSYLNVMNSTMHYLVGNILSLPILFDETRKPKIDALVQENIDMSKVDWDGFETSWDFERHPLVAGNGVQANGSGVSKYIFDSYAAWENECDNRFNTLKKNEEKLNDFFIDIYGMQDELTPDVEDKDVTVRKADLQRDIKSFISYAVGCMLGRYSLDTDGLAYAGGEWDASKYQTFQADKDNIIPICDDEYFEDDITGLFVKFVETVYGKDTLDANLKFIADALGGKGTPKEVIRNYFLNDFFNDHCKIYQKRPIYWLFDSGKKNGFKALVYMHRYQPDTIARMRTDYVHEQQSRYRTATADLESRIADASTAERVRLNKQLTKLRDQSEEIRKYEEKIHHLADQYIAIDLDDGVKVNYAKFQDVLAKIK